MQHITYAAFIFMANFILMRHDAYLDHLKALVRQDKWFSLWNVHLIYDLFAVDV